MYAHCHFTAAEKADGGRHLPARLPFPRLLQVLQEIYHAVQDSEAYAEEARQAGAVKMLTKLLKHAGERGAGNSLASSYITSHCVASQLCH